MKNPRLPKSKRRALARALHKDLQAIPRGKNGSRLGLRKRLKLLKDESLRHNEGTTSR